MEVPVITSVVQVVKVVCATKMTAAVHASLDSGGVDVTPCVV